MEDSYDGVIDFASPCGLFALTLDDDGKVAYAYLKRGETICGDVWLYNRCPTPILPEWTDYSKMPFANCEGYMHAEGHLETGVVPEEIRVMWEYQNRAATACVSIRGRIVAKVGDGDRPGYSAFASKDGPLAKVLRVEDATV